jgi:hypothetical protein
MFFSLPEVEVEVEDGEEGSRLQLDFAFLERGYGGLISTPGLYSAPSGRSAA